MQELNVETEADRSPSDAELRAIVDTVPVHVWTARADGSAVDFVNRRLLDYTGLSAAEGLGWGWTVAVHPDVDDDVRVSDALSSLLASAGLDVAVFASAAEFLDADTPDVPACLVLDLQRADVNGLDCKGNLRTDRHRRSSSSPDTATSHRQCGR
jgi:PAS domain-containing protein